MENLGHEYGGQTVLKNITAKLPEKGLCWLIGPSGSGKSTWLRLMAGLETPTSGRILVDGIPLGFSVADRLNYRRSIGMVFQQSNLFHHLSARENIALPLRVVHRMPAQSALDRADSLLASFGLTEHGHKRPSELSGGQQQRVALARAFSHKPQTIFLDEPTSALDPEMSASVLEAVRLLVQEGVQLVIVTHELAFARSLGGYVYFLNDGHITEEGRSDNIFRRPESDELKRFLKRMHPGY